ncbi:hypothetical protein [Janthinobacterium sp. PC23-8]|uniref:hypothetical protein n=1 Tax=Janthinobacterium sp. PC23-8 TaxID=2012679 RepID=UPI0011403050|nr:hypothetical protein [Janthinobacterium sp. PC23-8]
MQRDSRSLRLFTVEPHAYEPEKHSAILFSIVTRLKSNTEESYGTKVNILPASSFDLLVFPEVFLCSADLITLVNSLRSAGPTGCIHTGIRPDSSERFLFARDEVLKLSEDLIKAGARPDDLCRFSNWLINQKKNTHFNLGAVIAVDVDSKVRITLHPKVLRSKFELSAFPDSNMTEAKFLTLITLIPSEPSLLPITLQPLLCSDALIHDTDYPGTRPIDAISRYGNSFNNTIPDHIDIISLATCSPHTPSKDFPLWHIDFREGFLRMAKHDNNLRHRHAIIVMANFLQIPDNPRFGGLSGAFLPIPLHINRQPKSVVACQYATAENSHDPAWHINDVVVSKKLAHMICLKYPKILNSSTVTLLGFDLHRVLKEANHYNPSHGLLNYEILVGTTQPDGTIYFHEITNDI